MKLRETKKLHYNKYLYKLGIPSQLASYFRTELQKDGNLSYARDRLDTLSREYKSNKTTIPVQWGYSRTYVDYIPVEHYFDAIEIFRHLKGNSEKYLVRCERNQLMLYSNDRKFLIGLGNKLRSHHMEFWEPDPQNLDTLISNDNVILVDKKPRYEYKVVLGKKKGNTSLATWITKNPQLAKMGEVALDGVLNEGWVKGYYFFVRDKKTLLVAQLMVGDNISKIYKLVYKEE
jgi:hypothetical protein